MDTSSRDELLEHYRKRIDEFEGERTTMLARLEACGASHKRLHELEWENRRRVDEVSELQKALSSSQSYIFEERARLLQLQAENDELRLQELEDRRRIQHLMALTEPVEQEITYGRDGKPHSVARFHTAASEAKLQPPANGRKPAGERVMRTVYLPAADAEALQLRVESLLAQLHEQKRFSEERLGALLEDKALREQDAAAHRALAAQKVDDLAERLHRTETGLQQVTKDFILAQRAGREAECRAAGAEAALAEERAGAQRSVADAQSSAATVAAEARADAEARIEEYADKFRKQIVQRESDLGALEVVAATLKAQLGGQLAEATEKLAREQEASRQLQHRRALEVEGWANDVTLLRKALAATDRRLHQMRLAERLDCDERLDRLLDDLSRRAPDVLPPLGDDGDTEAGAAADDTDGDANAENSSAAANTPAQERGPGGVVGGGGGGKSAGPRSHKGSLASTTATQAGKDLDRVRAGIAVLDQRVRLARRKGRRLVPLEGGGAGGGGRRLPQPESGRRLVALDR